MVHCDHATILHDYGDMGPRKSWGHDLDLLESCNVIGHVIIRLAIYGFL